MSEPLFHPNTAKALAQLRVRLPQSLLLSGPRGVGVTTAALWLGEEHINDVLYPTDAKGERTEGGTLSAETVRKLYGQTRTQTSTRRIIVIDSADRMSSAAAAAFLKLLEEPSPNTYFILTSHQPQRLLPTIRSRVQHVKIQPLQQDQTDSLIASLGVDNPTKKAQLAFIAPGLPAELSRLAGDETYFQARAGVMSDARDLLQADPYQKLLIVHKYRQDRTSCLRLIDAALAILRRSLSAKPQSGIVDQIEQLLKIQERIAANGNTALQLAMFVV